MANGAQYLTVNGENLDSIELGAGQSCTFEVVSNNTSIYEDHIGFDDCNSLGNFSYVEKKQAAGACSEVNEVNLPDFCGYRVRADCSPSLGVHFVFEYVAQKLGETDLKLYISLTELLDSIHITVVPADIGTAFTYQGRLIDSNFPAEGPYDFQFKLYNAPQASAQQGDTVDINDLVVTDGYFTVEKLDFGIDVFAGEARWLDISVRPGESNNPGDFVPLNPRQEVTPAPYAIYAKTAENVVEEIVPQGVIVMWSGSIGNIPSGWALCNGSNGTPDLRDRFIVGAGGSYGVGSTGGSTQHNHGGNTAGHALTVAQMPAHTHTYSYSYDVYVGGDHCCEDGGYDMSHRNESTTSSGNNQPHSHGISNSNHLPPYYALAYIMKL